MYFKVIVRIYIQFTEKIQLRDKGQNSINVNLLATI